MANPIDAITPTGIRTADGTHHDLDVIVFATGFDAVDGSYTRVCIRGRNGETLKDRWADGGPTSYMGTFAAGFPNMFMVFGPQSAFCSLPPMLEAAVEYITAAIKRAEEMRRERGGGGQEKAVLVEATEEAERGWARMCEEVSAGSLFRQENSWIFGANIPGKPLACRFYFGGLKSYREQMREVIENGWRGFKPFVREVPDGVSKTTTPLAAETATVTS